MNLKTICSPLFLLVCLSGLLFQIQQVSELYFQFLTWSKIEYRVREVDDYQTISFCPRFTELMDRTRHKEYGIQLEAPIGLDNILKEMSTLTIKDILDLTPPESDIIHQCTIRGIKLSVPLLLNRSECEKFFTVIKAVNGERICYTFMPPKQANYSIGDVASSQTHTNSVYQLNMKPNLGRSTNAFFISYYNDVEGKEDPLESRPFQAEFVNTRTFNQSRFAVYGESTEITRLPAPFDTSCTPGHDREACYERCLIEKFKAIDRIPWSGYHRLPLPVKMFNELDLKNETMADVATKSFQECHSSCRTKKECLTRFSKTTIEVYWETTLYFNFAIVSMVPTAPHIIVTAVAFLNLIEYIVQIGTCFGMWFGLSIISFHPTRWKKMIKTKAQATNVETRPKRVFIVSKIYTVLPRRQFPTHLFKQQLHLNSRIVQDS